MALLLGGVVALAGCAEEGQGQAASRRNAVLLVDCSGSTAAFRSTWIPEVIGATAQALNRRQLVWIDCIDGSPLATARFVLRLDGRNIPSAYEGNEVLADEFNRARAASLRPKLEQLFAGTRRARGSGILDGLEAAGGLRPAQVVLWTDGLVIQAENRIDLNKPLSPASERGIVDTWAPRLAGLRGAQVTIVGVGTGAHSALSARQVRRLFPELLSKAGANVELSPAFVS